MQRERIRIGPTRPAQRPRDSGGDPAAHGAGGHHLHEHDAREDQRDAGERIGAEPPDEIRFDETGGRLRHQH
jgi:hypothetical protein